MLHFLYLSRLHHLVVHGDSFIPVAQNVREPSPASHRPVEQHFHFSRQQCVLVEIFVSEADAVSLTAGFRVVGAPSLSNHTHQSPEKMEMLIPSATF